MTSETLTIAKGKVRYWSIVRTHIHQLLAWGHTNALAQIEHSSQEDDITGYIVEAIGDKLRDPACPKWGEQYAVKENNPVRGRGRKGKHRKRPDIIFECTKHGRPEFVFEAKPICIGKHPVSNYLNEEALQRFVRSEYAPEYHEAGMLGYVQSHTVLDWVTWIKKAIDADSSGANALHLKPPQRAASVIVDFPHEWVSVHERDNGTSIAIYHILLKCC
jgi:hypothetical protein